MSNFEMNKLIATLDNQNLLTQEKEMLLQGLIDKLVSTDLESATLDNLQLAEEVIFESSLDGVQYYIVRCCPKSKLKINLSPREQAIAKLVAVGLPNKLIAHQLQISPWTVASHLRRMFVKLGVTSRTAMIAQLLAQNLLPK